MTEPTALAVVEDAFAWFNRLGRREIPLRREDVARHFAPDTRILIDNEMMGVGLDGMVGRFAEMLDKLAWWEAPMPFSPALSEGERAAAWYQYRYETRAGEAGVISIISIWTVAEGRVLETRENAVYQGASLTLARHDGKHDGD